MIQSIAGASAFDYKFQNKAMPITMNIKSSVNIDSVTVEVDSQLFFQRLIVFIQPEEINDAFSYDLCTREVS